jgi:hypothetical protein
MPHDCGFAIAFAATATAALTEFAITPAYGNPLA